MIVKDPRKKRIMLQIYYIELIIFSDGFNMIYNVWICCFDY